MAKRREKRRGLSEKILVGLMAERVNWATSSSTVHMAKFVKLSLKVSHRRNDLQHLLFG